MRDDYNWNNLPIELLIAVVLRLSFAEDYVRFKAVSKSWKIAIQEVQNPCLPPRHPMLLLAEQVAPGGILAHAAFDDNDIDDKDSDDDCDDDSDDPDNNDDNDDPNNDDHDHNSTDSDDDFEEYSRDLLSRYDYRNNSIGCSRGIYSLSTGKTYFISLPEAAGRVILGTNKGWLLTLGRDLQINLLHPLFRHQIPLPPMLTFPIQYDYYEDFTPEDRTFMFVQKVVLSSRVPTKDNISSPDKHHDTIPIVMAVYGECGYLGFARLGDKVWSDVNIPSHFWRDIVYHKEKFYTVNDRGVVFVCDTYVDDNKKLGFRGTEIASLPIKTVGPLNENYLVETLSGSGLLLVVRTRRIKYYKLPHRTRTKYRTIDFSVWRLELRYCERDDNPSYTLTREDNLENEAILVGRGSSVSVSSSKIIKSNCIYFTDDNLETYSRTGGGHDMGIFNIKSHTIEPHFEGESIHPICPPLWYV